MKTGEDIIKKCISLFFLVLYFFVVSTYMICLPKYTSAEPAVSAVSNPVRVHKANNANSLYLQLRCAFKSVPENKRKAIDLLIKTTALVFLLIFSGAVLPGLIRKSRPALTKFLYTQKHYYLSFCTLRI